MKNLIYILTTAILITSCRSIDKMVESGNYEQALRYGVDKLRGEKNKKTKYVKALEKAYARINEADLELIKSLKLTGNNKSLHIIIDTYTAMQDRQNYVLPLLPLISEDGYPATMKIVDYTTKLHTAKIEASDKHYNTGVQKLEYAKENKDKLAAREAYYHFLDSNTYFDNYRNSDALIKDAYDVGQTNILIEPYVAGSNIAYYHTGNIISQLQLSKLNTIWKKYFTDDIQNNIDYIATIEVIEIIPGKEVERYSTYTNTKEIVDGTRPKRNKRGKIVRDTLGNVIYEENRIEVSANIEELIREKSAQMSGKIVVVEALTNRHVNTTPINATYVFEDYSSVINGDKRALPSERNNRVKSYCAPFPTDYEMTTNLAYEYKKAAESIIKNEQII